MEGAEERWSFVTRFGFCFAFVYFVLYLLPFPLDVLPGTESIVEQYFNLWSSIVHAAGRAVFGVTITVDPNGSGDTTFNYVQVFCFAAIALIVTPVWWIIDRRRPNDKRLLGWLRIYIRFGLASAMLGYGAFKVIQAQFPPPGFGRLLQPFGEASPMGLLWTFMGASRSYNVFTGLSEMVGGFLLTMRRTTLLGALVSAGVMANVAMLNFSYDVPVKLYSLNLLLMAVFLALPELARLTRFFVLNRAVEPSSFAGPLARGPLRWATLVVRTAFVAFLIYAPVNQAIEGLQMMEGMKTPLHGIWVVDEFSTGGKIVPPLLSQEARWRRVFFDRGEMGVQLIDDSRIRYRLKLDAEKHVLGLTPREDPSKEYSLSYTPPVRETMTVTGAIDGQPIRATLHRIPTPRFLLVDRGFHWVSEYPFNR